MTDIGLETVTGKLNVVGFETVAKSHRQAKRLGNRYVELAHWIEQMLAKSRSDVDVAADHFNLDRARLLSDIGRAVEDLNKNQTESPQYSAAVIEALDRGWHYATLYFSEPQIRTGHVLVGVLKTDRLRNALFAVSKEFAKISVDVLMAEHRKIWAHSDEENLRPVDGSGLSEARTAHDTASRNQTALDRFSQDLTQRACAGEMDAILGRDEEIRKIVDVLMRRRQNNPILTGEAGVGKTAVVEGFAQAIVSGDVPPPLRGVTLRALDIGLLQAGASMKGEFEERLRSVIDEVQKSSTPIILFIDEAHTLIGAGAAAGAGDAANLLKPALARGSLRTIAATTWSEYRRYFEKDPALARRFQPIQIDEPDAAHAAVMLRGILAPMEKHHDVRISDAAIAAAVTLSQRYIPARQLPDKAVSLLDTASARVAISQTTTPAAIADRRVKIAALEQEKSALLADRDLGSDMTARINEIDAAVADAEEKLAALEAAWSLEKGIVDEVRVLRRELAGAEEDQTAAFENRGKLTERLGALAALDPESRAIYPHVDEQAVASVVSDWTGIPIGRMVRNEIETILRLPELLGKRVVGQSHGLAMIAKRIETNRAKLDNPNKPIGVFMLCGPSGVGKTETALALAEALYGGEQNIITINMSEFQEPHTVSTLKGAPPGYVGYGEGGRLTEAVRRRPYSVVLLDEIEKAHADVHEIFFQVFDKGQMEDGSGRRIDFKNTLIILTSNVGTELIMELGADPAYREDPEALGAALRPELQRVFPPALLGRIVVIPYFPLSAEMLSGIVRLQLDRIGKRVKENHGSTFFYDDAVADHIVSLCNDPDSGGRVIDNIITNTLLPALSREFLKRSLAKEEVRAARVTMKDGAFYYELGQSR
jgi:type VI secretion system protein VasG